MRIQVTTKISSTLTLQHRTTSKDIANSVSKFGGIFFTPI